MFLAVNGVSVLISESDTRPDSELVLLSDIDMLLLDIGRGMFLAVNGVSVLISESDTTLDSGKGISLPLAGEPKLEFLDPIVPSLIQIISPLAKC